MVTLTVSLPATPCFRQVLKDGLRLVLLDRFWHHVQDVMHNSRAQFEIEVRFYTLLRDRLRDTFRIATLELTCEQVAEPTLEKGHNTPHEEEPYSPSGGPEATSRALSNRTGVEAVINEVLEVLRHAYLPHELR